MRSLILVTLLISLFFALPCSARVLVLDLENPDPSNHSALKPYMIEVRKQIERRFLESPPSEGGEASFSFSIDRFGEVNDLDVKGSDSGSAETAGRMAILNAAPFNNPPLTSQPCLKITARFSAEKWSAGMVNTVSKTNKSVPPTAQPYQRPYQSTSSPQVAPGATVNAPSRLQQAQALQDALIRQGINQMQPKPLMPPVHRAKRSRRENLAYRISNQTRQRFDAQYNAEVRRYNDAKKQQLENARLAQQNLVTLSNSIVDSEIKSKSQGSSSSGPVTNTLAIVRNNEGEILKLEDESLWQVDPDDVKVVQRWILGSKIIVSPRTEGEFTHILVQPDSGDKANAKRLK